MTKEARHYSIFGLSIRSELDLDLPECLPSGGDEVIVRFGSIPEPPLSDGVHSSGRRALLVIDDIGRFLVTDGKSIVVEPAAGAHPRNLRLYLLGSAMGLLLHQRGLLPLHANAIEIDRKAVAFMGRSGEGKSTLAAWFHDQGFRIIADDVCVVHFDGEGRPLAAPGLPRLRLWRESLETSGRDPSQFTYSYAGAEEWDKYDVPLPGDRVATSMTPLAGIYLLERGDQLQITPLSGLAAAEALFANTYRGTQVPRSGKPREHWEACLGLIERVPLFRLQRPWGHDLLAEQGEAIVRHIREGLVIDRKSH